MTYAANGGLVSMPTANTRPAASDHPSLVNPSVSKITTRATATIAASGRSSWNRCAENTTNGAQPKRTAATTPSVPPATRRPSR